ncbi:MAG: TM1802 family CRISPR-associated protein, partial [Atribacterota bacterium]
KPILEKLNYQGMPWPKVRQLANILFEKLRQYDRLRFTERLYAAMKTLLDGYRDEWPLSPEENTFYILSGYSYGVLVSAQMSKKEEGEENV